MALAPTLWRTCRVLANDARLRCFAAVVNHPGAPVGGVARVAGIPLCLASLYLRQIQARGLLQATRVSRWVYYAAEADASVAHASAVLAALRQCALRRADDRTAVIRVLTAFTHPRRLTLLAEIGRRGPCVTGDLPRATGISRKALERHLRKLAARGLIAGTPSGWMVVQPDDPLAAALLTATGARG